MQMPLHCFSKSLKSRLSIFRLNMSRELPILFFTNFYLAQSKRAAQRLEAAALCDLHQGDTASAVKNLRAMLALVKAMRDERLVISELVRIAIAQIALTANWEILQSPNMTDEQLAELQRDWMGLDFIHGMKMRWRWSVWRGG